MSTTTTIDRHHQISAKDLQQITQRVDRLQLLTLDALSDVRKLAHSEIRDHAIAELEVQYLAITELSYKCHEAANI